MDDKAKKLYDKLVKSCGSILPEEHFRIDDNIMPNEDFIFSLKYNPNLYAMFIFKDLRTMMDLVDNPESRLHKSYPFEIGIHRDRKGLMGWVDNKTGATGIPSYVFLKSRKSFEALCDFLEYRNKKYIQNGRDKKQQK